MLHLLHHVTVSQRCNFQADWTRTRWGRLRQATGQGVSEALMLLPDTRKANKKRHNMRYQADNTVKNTLGF